MQSYEDLEKYFYEDQDFFWITWLRVLEDFVPAKLFRPRTICDWMKLEADPPLICGTSYLRRLKGCGKEADG